MKNNLSNILTILASVTLTLNFSEKSIAATYIFNQIGFPNGFQVDGTITTDAMGDLTLNDLNEADYLIRVFDNTSVNYTLTTANSTWSSFTSGLSELSLTANETELDLDFLTRGDFDIAFLSLTNDSNSTERWEFRQQSDIGSLVATNVTLGFAGGFSNKNLVPDSQLRFSNIVNSFNVSHGGFPGGGRVTGMFGGVDGDNNGLIESSELISYMMSFEGGSDSLLVNFNQDKKDVELFSFEPASGSLNAVSSDGFREYDSLFGTVSTQIQTTEDLSVTQELENFFSFSQPGFVGGGIVTGAFSGEDLNDDGFISFVDGEVSFYDMNLQGNNNSIVDFTHNLTELNLLLYEPASGSLNVFSSDDFRDYDGSFGLIEVTLEQENLEPAIVTPKAKVPEPSTIIGFILLGLGALSRKRK